MVATTNNTDMAIIEEVTAGTTPDTPAFQIIPTTGGSPVLNITTAVSEVIRSDRQTDDLIPVDAEVTGDLNFELSYAAYKPIIEALAQNDTVGTISIAAATAVGASSTITNSGIEAAVNVGDVFRVTSANEVDIDGIYTCVSNAIADEITVHPPLPIAAAAIDLVLAASAIVTNGADASKKFTIRKRITSDGSIYYYYFKGCEIAKLTLDLTTGSIVSGAFSVVGRTETTDTSPIAGETTVATAPYTILNSVTSLGFIHVDGVSLGDCSFNTFNFTYDNQVNSAKSLGTFGACDTASYSVMASASVEAYFRNLDLYNKFKTSSSLAVTLQLTDGDGNTIGLSIPYCKFENLDSPISGKDQFLTQSGSLKALRDTDSDSMVRFSFIDAI